MAPPLDYKLLQLPFGQGLAQEIAPALVPAGKLSVADQATIDKKGSVQQRDGTDALALDLYNYTLDAGPDTYIDAARHLIPDGRGTLMTSPYRMYSYQEADEQWQDMDNAYEADIRRTIQCGRVGKADAPGYADMAYLEVSGKKWLIASEPNRVTFIDYNTESIVESFEWTDTGGNGMTRVIAAFNKVYVFWHDKTNQKIKAAIWDGYDIEAGPTQTIASSGLASDYGVFDACADTSGLYLAYWEDDGAGTVGTRVQLIASDFSWTTTRLVPFKSAPEVPNAEMSIDVDDGNYVWVAYDTASTLEIHAICLNDPALTLVYGATTVRAGYDNVRVGVVADTGNGRAFVAWEQANGSLTDTARSLNGDWIEDDGTMTPVSKTYHVGMISKPWIRDSLVYIVGYVFEQMPSFYRDPESGDYIDLYVYQRNAYVLELRQGSASAGGVPD